MWWRWYPYSLGSVVLLLLGMVAPNNHEIPIDWVPGTAEHHPPAPQRRTEPPGPPAPQRALKAPPAPSGSASQDTVWDMAMPRVKMKPIPLAYLRQQLDRVTSPQDLVRLFMDTDLGDPHLSHWVTRSARSTTLQGGHGFQLRDPDLESTRRVKESALFGSGDGEKRIQLDDDTYGDRDNHVIDTGNIDDDEDGDKIVDEYLDYPGDAPMGGDLEVFAAALYHIEEMRSCSSAQCKDPKPIVQHMRDPEGWNRIYIPACTILHRCLNHTGCCGDSSRECVPKTMHVIDKAFLVVDQMALKDDYVTFHPKMATIVSLVNHTECECREKPGMPRCTKTCPAPFRVTRDGGESTCSCFQKAYEDHCECDEVKDGVKPLSNDGLVCIKGGNCYNPQCTAGDFDVKTGYCPLSDQYSLPEFLFDKPEDRRNYRKHLRHLNITCKARQKDITAQTMPRPTVAETPISEKSKVEKSSRSAHVTEAPKGTQSMNISKKYIESTSMGTLDLEPPPGGSVGGVGTSSIPSGDFSDRGYISTKSVTGSAQSPSKDGASATLLETTVPGDATESSREPTAMAGLKTVAPTASISALSPTAKGRRGWTRPPSPALDKTKWTERDRAVATGTPLVLHTLKPYSQSKNRRLDSGATSASEGQKYVADPTRDTLSSLISTRRLRPKFGISSRWHERFSSRPVLETTNTRVRLNPSHTPSKIPTSFATPTESSTVTVPPKFEPSPSSLSSVLSSSSRFTQPSSTKVKVHARTRPHRKGRKPPGSSPAPGESVLNGFYSYDYSVGEGSGDGFQYPFT